MSAARFFVDDEDGYLNWLAEHPDGFVVNTPRAASPRYMVLHGASCRTISRYNKMARPGGFTERQYANACATTVAGLANWIRDHGRPDGSFTSICSFCNPDG